MDSQKKVPLVCPRCGVYRMQAVSPMQARCPGCGFTLSGGMLWTLVEILSLPEVLGNPSTKVLQYADMATGGAKKVVK